MAQIPKYRVSLSAAQIEHALKLCKLEKPISNTSMELAGILAVALTKIDNDVRAPAYIVSPKMTIEEGLGLTVVPSTPASRSGYTLNGVSWSSKEDYWAACNYLYNTSPESCSVEQIKAAKEHMYLNDLMTDEEILDFEENM